MEVKQSDLSRVTQESVGLLIYGIFAALKQEGGLSLNKMIQAAGLPIQPIATALKDCKILENQGKTGLGASWKWLPASGPNDVIILRVFTNYQNQVKEYREAMQKKKDKFNGVNREESGHPVKVPCKPGEQPSVFIRERLECLEDRQRHIIDLLETLCNNLGLTETLGGHKIA